ncbi:hypothetical protein SEA_GUYFAGIERI_14 [Rhodococcus phage GuyFagieri]|nr:hypothetical protein SEA_GUYFAGIERI_14 [Rhodococcus phage GuyFagieri]
MSTQTLTPIDQRAFAQDFLLNYPGRVANVAGQVVGPNWLGEFFVARDGHYNGLADETVVEFELLTEDRKALLTPQDKMDFVIRVEREKERQDRTGFQATPQWREINDAERYIKSPHLWM